MRLDRQENIKIARRAAPHTRLTLTGQTDARSVLNTGRYVDGQRPLFRHAALTATLAAGIGDCLTATMTGRAGALDRKEALRGAHTTGTGAGRAGLGLGAGLGAGTGAGFTGHGSRNTDLRGFALVGFLQRDFHVVAQVGAAFTPAGRAARTSTAHHLAEDILEDVGEPAAGKTGTGTTAAAHAALLEGGVAETVIGGALLGILQGLVGLVDLLEFLLGVRIAGILVGVILHGELAEGTFQFLLVRTALDPERVVKISLGHDALPSSSVCRTPGQIQVMNLAWRGSGDLSPDPDAGSCRQADFLSSSLTSSKSASTTLSSPEALSPPSAAAPSA